MTGFKPAQWGHIYHSGQRSNHSATGQGQTKLKHAKGNGWQGDYWACHFLDVNIQILQEMAHHLYIPNHDG